jgi:uncharacterized membrane protein YwzB
VKPDGREILDYFLQGLSQAFGDLLILSITLGGAACAYLLYSFPESKVLKERLQALFPRQKAQTQARLNFVISILLGTFVAIVLLQPRTYKEAFLAGFAWLGALRHILSPAHKPPGGSKP